MKENNLSKWLYKNNCFLKQGDIRKYTHLCLDGGKFCIPQLLNNEFIDIYSEGLGNGEKYYICEVPTQICRMYSDLDFIDKEPFSIEEIKKVVKVIYDVVKYYYDDNFDIIVCTTNNKEVTRNKMKLVKTGVHLIWKNLHVTRKNALNLSKLFVKALVEKFGEREEYNKWDDVVDECVYSENNSSLRMIGSSKISRKRKTNKENGEKEVVFVDEGRVYSPIWICGENDNLFKNINDTIKNCTIRVFESETDSIVEIPEFIENKINKKSVGKSIISNDEMFVKLETFIRTSTIPQWDRPLKYLKKQGRFYVAKIDQGMYCLNIEREHNSCGIYFQITEEGFFQRCFCKCKTLDGRISGIMCKDFKSRKFRLPYYLKTLMFDKKNSKNKNNDMNRVSSKGVPTIFGSYNTLKYDKNAYLKMSMNTILHIEDLIKNNESI